MSASAAPPTYNETMQQNPSLPAGAYQPSYGTVNLPPAGGYQHPHYPPAGSAYPPPPGSYDNKGYPSQPMGYPSGSVPSYHTSNVVIQSPTQQVVLVGGCPACRVGILEDDFTCLGVLCAILFFPIGLLCCLAMRQRRCNHCGAVFG
ncbi:brain protein I3 [Biomphalaria pfeifferi]|uniref:Membrane protein BRI3 n=1 Tax=Biomphalaria pfeifferi TaxID=112525 RepID=A0AAD8BKH7_BIOPF|nr:brain protein I3 [Biomphalaria pfeifferi]